MRVEEVASQNRWIERMRKEGREIVGEDQLQEEERIEDQEKRHHFTL